MLIKASRRDAGSTGSEPALGLDDLVAQLNSADSSHRRAAARQLGAHPDALDALNERLSIEAAPSVRSVILTSLISQKSQHAAELLATHLRSEDVALRNAVIAALQEMPDQVGELVPKLLKDNDSDVRIFAVNILSALPHPDTPSWLIQVITEDPHLNVCASAVDCLAEVGDDRATEALRALAERFKENAFIRFAVDAALRRIGSS